MGSNTVVTSAAGAESPPSPLVPSLAPSSQAPEASNGSSLAAATTATTADDGTVTDVDAPPEAKPKGPHVDGRKQFADSPPEPFLDTPVVRLVSDADVKRFQERIQGQLFLAPLTKGGNLPFRRLCVDFGCNVTVSEMVFARFLLKGNPVEKARLRRHASEPLYGVQIATNQISEGVNAGRLAFDAGADFLDLNCGCPIHETWKRGLGAVLNPKP
jgi:tRNA-dihydrouridine synthase 3